MAAALGEKLALPVVHLDQLRLEPGTWTERPDAHFLSAVEAAVAQEIWIIEGNYHSFLAGRLERSTSVISLASLRLGNFARYLSRCLAFSGRTGRMANAGEAPNWLMTRYILWDESRKRKHRRQLVKKAKGFAFLSNSFGELQQLYKAWNLKPTG